MMGDNIDPNAFAGLLKPVEHYSRLATAYFMHKPNLIYAEFTSALNLLGFTVLKSRSERLFQAVITSNSSCSQTEFEIALMMLDFTPDPATSSISMVDIFEHHCSGSSLVLLLTDFISLVRELGVLADEKRDSDLRKVFRKYSTSDGHIPYEKFLNAWCRAIINAQKQLKSIGHEIGRSAVVSAVLVAPLRWQRYSDCLKNIIKEADESVRCEFFGLKEKLLHFKRQFREKIDKKNRSTKSRNSRRSRSLTIAVSKEKRDTQLYERQLEELAAKREQQEREFKERQMRQKNEDDLKFKEDIVRRSRKRDNDIRNQMANQSGGRLVLSGNSLKEIPGKFYKGSDACRRLNDLVVLDLSQNMLSELPPMGFCFHLRSLRKLSLSGNQLRCFPPEELSDLVNLEILQASGNRLYTIPTSIDGLEKLVVLDLSLNNLKSLPNEIGSLVLLRVLNLQRNYIQCLPTTMGSLSSIDTIDLSRNALRVLPDEIVHVISIRNFDISQNHLLELPDDFGYLCQLRTLNISNNNIQVLPKSMSQMTSMTLFSALYNQLRDISPIGSWTNLLEISVKSNNLLRLPEKVKLCSCQSIDMSENPIEEFPPEFGTSSSLMEIVAHSIAIKHLPREIGALSKLVDLDISRGCLEALPFEFGLLRSLQRLDISYNKVKELPNSVGGLLCLDALNASHNMIIALPPTLANIVTLKSLDLSANMIESFAAILCSGLGNNLVSLNLASNILKFLPIGFAKFSKLQSLDLHHNLLRALPLDFVEVLSRSLLDFVDFSENPLDLIPPKNIFGADVDIIYLRNWLKLENTVYSFCCKEWECNKDGYINCKLCVDAFVFGSEEFGVIGVRAQMGDTDAWDESLTPHIKSFFFRCKSLGALPCYHLTSELEISQRKILFQSSESRRDELSLRAKDEAREEEERMHHLYYHRFDERLTNAITYQEQKQLAKEKINHEVNVKLLEDVEVRTVVQEKRASNLRQDKFLKEKIFLTKQKCDMESSLCSSGRINPRRTLPYETIPCWKENSELDAK